MPYLKLAQVSKEHIIDIVLYHDEGLFIPVHISGNSNVVDPVERNDLAILQNNGIWIFKDLASQGRMPLVVQQNTSYLASQSAASFQVTLNDN